jgi:hypothetical protein
MFFPVELLIAPFNVTDHVVDKGSPASTKLTGTVGVDAKSAVCVIGPFIDTEAGLFPPV